MKKTEAKARQKKRKSCKDGTIFIPGNFFLCPRSSHFRLVRALALLCICYKKGVCNFCDFFSLLRGGRFFDPNLKIGVHLFGVIWQKKKMRQRSMSVYQPRDDNQAVQEV